MRATVPQLFARQDMRRVASQTFLRPTALMKEFASSGTTSNSGHLGLSSLDVLGDGGGSDLSDHSFAVIFVASDTALLEEVGDIFLRGGRDRKSVV